MEEQQRRYYTSLYEIAAAVNSAGTPDIVLHTIVESVAKALNAKACSLMLLTPDRKLLFHTADHGLSERYVRKGPVSADKSIAEALEGKPVAVKNAGEDERVQYRRQAKEEGIVSILSAPVTLAGDVVGVIRVYTGKPYHFSEPDVYFVTAVANLGAIALENAKLLNSVKKDYEALRRDIAEWRAALGYESQAGWSVVPPEE